MTEEVKPRVEENEEQATQESTESREKRTFYFVVENATRFDTKKQVEDWITENGMKEGVSIIRGQKIEASAKQVYVLG